MSRMLTDFRRRLPLAWVALRGWGPRQWSAAAGSTLAVALLIGFATVLIPNGFFSREIPPVAWNYPVWISTSALTGLLAATYIRPPAASETELAYATHDAGRPAASGSRWGVAGGLLAWFAVGCPVCNKVALLAMGYSGAITYFAPLQPWLAALALAVTIPAVVLRLSGQVECAVPQRRRRLREGIPS